MRMYIINIDGVGDFFFRMGSVNKQSVLQFLKLHDLEGSRIDLEIANVDTSHTEYETERVIDNAMEIYKFLCD
jgi:hypothetical protein